MDLKELVKFTEWQRKVDVRLDDYTPEQLVNLYRAQQIPSPLPYSQRIVSDQLLEACRDYLEHMQRAKIEGFEGSDKGLDRYIFEYALMMIYGEDIFDWINEQLD